nr:hypothetical protein [Tanacetum cinerariifolium]
MKVNAAMHKLTTAGEGTTCLPNAAIFEELARMGTMASAIICLANNQNFNFSKYILDNMMKNLEAGVKFYVFLRFFQVFMNHQLGDMSHHKGIFVNPSLTKMVFINMKRVGTSFSGRKHKSRRKQRKETEVPHTEPQTKEYIPTPSHDPLPSCEDKMKLSELMEIYLKLPGRVLYLEKIKTNQAAKIKKLKQRVMKLEGKKKNRTNGLKRLYKGRIAEIDANEDLSLINETTQDQWRMNDEYLFRVKDLNGDEVIVDVTTGENVEKDATVAEKDVNAVADEVVSIAKSIEGITAATTPKISKDDVILAQTLTEIKAAKSMATGVTIQEPSNFRTTSPSQSSQPLQTKDKGKGIMVEPKKPLKRKDQITLDEKVVKKLEAKMKAEMDEEERITREKDKANIVLIENGMMFKPQLMLIAMDSEVMEGSKKNQAKVTEGSSKREGDEIEEESAKRQGLEKEDDTVDYEVEMAYDLLRLIRRKINEGYIHA